MSSVPLRTSSLYSRSTTSLSSSAESSSPSNYNPSIQLLNAMPSTMPRSAVPTAQRLILVATVLSAHLAESDIAHAFLGRFALSLRGANSTPKWIDVDVTRPLIGGATKITEMIASHPEFACHTSPLDAQADSNSNVANHPHQVARLLVSHKSGIFLRVSVGAIAHLRKKTIHVSAHTTNAHAPSVLPLLTPARHFLETVYLASSAEGREEDAQDLVWMQQNLKMELLNEPNTLKKTWDDGRLQLLVERFPSFRRSAVDLGLAVISDNLDVTDTQLTASRSRNQ